MCFKCKTSKAEVGCWVECAYHGVTCAWRNHQKVMGTARTGAGVGEAARAFVLGVFSVQFRKDREAYHTHQVPH